MKYLLDNNIISEPTKAKPNSRVLKQLELYSIFACTSAHVWNELWYGVHRIEQATRRQALQDYLAHLIEDGLQVLPFTQEAAEWLAAEQVRLEGLGLTPSDFDSQIAAVAVVNNLVLVTRNIKDFALFSGLRLENWFDE